MQPGSPIATQKGYTLKARTADEDGDQGERCEQSGREQIRLKLALYTPKVQFMQARVGSWVDFVWPGRGLRRLDRGAWR